jgi:predicted Fe-Mo cluster-binding NifX family protein
MKPTFSATYRIRAVLPVWNDRIAPLFDVARSLRLVELESGRIIRREDVMMPDVPAASKAVRLVEMGTQVLVCGAISDSLRSMIMAHGIRVIPFLAGGIAEIEQALLSDSLDLPRFAMPGWRKRRQMPGAFVGCPAEKERRVGGRNTQNR